MGYPNLVRDKNGRFVKGFKHTEESKRKMSLHRSGENHGMWKGGRYQVTKGYYYRHDPKHHFATNDGYVMEHRLVWEEFHKASLLPWADVHHKDGNKINNIIDNLEALIHGKHTTLTNTKDMSSRICYMCKGNETYFDKRYDRPMWYKNKSGGFLCKSCYDRSREQLP